MLVHAEGRDSAQPVRVVDADGGLEFDRVPQGVPVHPEPTRDRSHRGGIALQAADGPPHRAGGEQRAWARQV